MLNILANSFIAAARLELDPAGRAGRFLPPRDEIWDTARAPGFRSIPKAPRDGR